MTVADNPEIDDRTVLTPFAVSVGFNIATITGMLDNPQQAWVNYGTATGVYTNIANPIFGTRVRNYDGTVQGYSYSWTLRNIQLAASQAYFARVYFRDGTSTAELTWTQPGLNPNSSDLVAIQNKAKLQLARISNIATRGSRQGWLSASAWAGLQNALKIVQEYNRIKWFDGR